MALSGSPFDRFLAQKYFSSLDGLRCLSIVMVIWHHSSAQAHGSGLRGYLGVQLFFVISGFLITTLLLRERAVNGRIALASFYARRTLRIFPLYYAVLLLYVVVVYLAKPQTAEDVQSRQDFFSNLPYYATYTSNWMVNLRFDRRVIFYFAWSLATEEQFYLFWPSVVRTSRRWFVPLAVAALLIVVNQSSGQLVRQGLLGSSSLFTEIIASISTPILLGCILACVLHRPAGFRAAYRVLGAKWSAPMALCALFIGACRHELPDDFVGCLMTWLVGACCIREDHLLKPMLANPIARYVGSISYGMYLLHMLALNVVRRVLPSYLQLPPLLFPLALGVTIAVASISFRFYERPFLRLKNWFRVQPKRPDHAAEPEVTAIARAATLDRQIDR
jgi:peptidoglycan/LPS O-acetylase OafA/YrhL